MQPPEGDEEEIKRIKNLESKQIINQTSNIISGNKSRKKFIQIKT